MGDRLDQLWAEANDDEIETINAVALRAGLLWQCVCRWYNESAKESCDDCGRRRYETYANRLREAATVLRDLGGDSEADLADACDYAANGHNVNAWATAAPPIGVASPDERQT